MSEEVVENPDILTGLNSGKYQGAFPRSISRTIESVIKHPCLHLFSGSSLIGDCRVDLEHRNATDNKDVYKFIQEDKSNWKFVILDPDYFIQRKDVKLSGHARYDSVSGNVLAWRLIEDYLKLHADNVLWFDMCAPRPKGFDRKKIWLYIQGGYCNVRVLSWLTRVGERL